METQIENKAILSGRYELIKPLGEGSDGTVYLARHQSLGQERAVKVFPKSSAPSLFALSEANVLKALNHPGIPTIYDLEEDQTNYYLVEEYIRGESLENFLLLQQSISQELFFKFCEQLCDIFVYLHNLCPSPLVYQDLKPEHIIVCGMQLKLIDFSVCAFYEDSGDDFKTFGNVAFSAPELFSGASASAAGDLYSIGKIMEFMIPYVDGALPRKVLQIIQKATAEQPDLRYETAEELSAAICGADDDSGRTHLVNTIAVVGTHSGCGATHIAVSLTCTLNALGRDALYYEENSTDSLRRALPHMRHVWEREGCYMQGYFKGYPKYGEGVKISERRADISVIDYGCNVPADLAAADLILLVCGGAPWHRSIDQVLGLFQGTVKDRLRIIANLCDREAALCFAKQLDAPVYLYPYDTDPFGDGDGKRRFAEWLSFGKRGKASFLRTHGQYYRKSGQ
ncbi:MAG: serine/threonine protein kinase [Clostridiales bacterium]|nr:serine/threonine protein kinase [Clostridiales bacterium]